MRDRMFGLENEYGFAAQDSMGRALSVENALPRFMSLASCRLMNLPEGNGHAMFLSNGARLYLDCMHPEMTTPEVTSPVDAVRYVLAGERILHALAEELARDDPSVSQAIVFRCNVDYSAASGTTWGAHESYLHRADPDRLAQHLIPHLVSRPIISGAGGFMPLDSGLRFTLSPRAALMVHTTSGSSTNSRGIFHTKNEPLCANYNRLHVLFGESLCSQTAQFLKVGTTALVVALIEAGFHPGTQVQLRAPLDAMHAFAADPLCRSSAPTIMGLSVSALDIQRHYLSAVEGHMNDDFMPSWAARVCGVWRQNLDRLENGPEAVDGCLDWAIKLSLYKEHAARRGFSWDSIPVWSDAYRVIRQQLGVEGLSARRTDYLRILSTSQPTQASIDHVSSMLSEASLSWDDFPAFITLCAELRELDIRFGQLGPDGVFNALDASEQLDHRVEGVDEIEVACMYPPTLGRAAARGRAVREINEAGEVGHCGWDFVVNRTQGSKLLLRDPWQTVLNWQRSPSSVVPPHFEDQPGGVTPMSRAIRHARLLGIQERRRPR